jgi:hypothetical protein
VEYIVTFITYIQGASQFMHGESCDDCEARFNNCHKTLATRSWALLALPQSAYQLGPGSAQPHI